MSIITLTTDFGLKDHFVGSLKGKLISGYNEATIIDISHDIDLFNSLEAAYCISAAYNSFPKGTIHIIGVDSERTNETQHIAIQWDDHYFICADNGILSTLTQKKVAQKIVAINIHDRLNKDATDMDVFVAVACHIARGGLLNVIGKEITALKKVNELVAVVSDDLKIIKGNIV
ncbi:MAG: SAM-dependent chlorinase/fluorinase, partial [Flavobacterium sp.]